MSIQRTNTRLADKAAFRLLAIAFLLFSFASFAAADEPGESIKVERLSFPVSLSDGSAAAVVGYLY